MKRYCDSCRQYCDEAAMFCPKCGQYTTLVEVERIAPEGEIIYPLAHYQLSYKDTFLYVVGRKFIDANGRASRGEFFRFLLVWLLVMAGILAVFYGLTVGLNLGVYLIFFAWFLLITIGLLSLIPLLALCVRRLHDTDKSSALIFLLLIPLIGPVILFVFMCLKGKQEDNQYGEALRNIVIDKRLASIMKVSPTSSALTTQILVVLLVSAIGIYGVSSSSMAPDNKTELSGWLTNLIVGEGSEEAAQAAAQGYFDAVNEKDYDKAFTYVTSQGNTNPVEKQKWLESMKSAPKQITVGPLRWKQISFVNNRKRIICEADLQITKPGEGAVEASHMTRYISFLEEDGEWRIEGFYKEMPEIKKE